MSLGGGSRARAETVSKVAPTSRLLYPSARIGPEMRAHCRKRNLGKGGAALSRRRATEMSVGAGGRGERGTVEDCPVTKKREDRRSWRKGMGAHHHSFTPVLNAHTLLCWRVATLGTLKHPETKASEATTTTITPSCGMAPKNTMRKADNGPSFET